MWKPLGETKNKPSSADDLGFRIFFWCSPPQVLATGLSGLYSSLPTKLEVPSEEWHCLHREDWLRVPSLVQFLNSLEFCNAVIQVIMCAVWRKMVAVITKVHLLKCGCNSARLQFLLTYLCETDCYQVAHPSIKDQLVAYIYNGFLVPVLAPALHKVGLFFFNSFFNKNTWKRIGSEPHAV